MSLMLLLLVLWLLFLSAQHDPRDIGRNLPAPGAVAPSGWLSDIVKTPCEAGCDDGWFYSEPSGVAAIPHTAQVCRACNWEPITKEIGGRPKRDQRVSS